MSFGPQGKYLARGFGVCVTVLLAAPATAETISQPAKVVELFTSQGCSSCPPANAQVVEVDAGQPDVLALTYGVTYWDYLGWEDTFGHKAFTKRQKAYDAAINSGVYTPMMVVDGAAHGSRLTQSKLAGEAVPKSVTFSRHSGELCVESDVPAGSKLALVHYEPGEQTVSVKKGENGGRTLTLANVVTGIDYKNWTGTPICGLHAMKGLAVLAHDAETAKIIGAASLEP